MIIRKTTHKGADGQRQTRYSISFDGEPVALMSFTTLSAAALVVRFIKGGSLPDALAENALALLEGGEQDDN